MIRSILTALLVATLLPLGSADAAYVIEIDVDGADDAAITFNPNFSFGGDTTAANQSVTTGAIGLTGGDSIFGGDGANDPDTYEYTYTPAVDGDNLALANGTALNTTGDTATGLSAGEVGVYAVYGAWPITSGVSGGPVIYTLLDSSNNTLASVGVDQNNLDGQWFKLFDALLADASETYTLRQQSSANSFVSMRSSGVLFDLVTPIPEPMAGLLLIAMTSLAACRR